MAALQRAGIAFTEVTYTHHADATDFGAEAVRETGRDATSVFKTLVVATGPRTLAVAVVPVSGQLNLKALATALGVKKVEMADPASVERSTGYVLGGVSPLGQRTPLTTVIDSSAAALPALCVSGGKRGLQLELAPEDLLRATNGRWASIGR